MMITPAPTTQTSSTSSATRPFINTSSFILSAYTKSKATVQLTTAHTSGSPVPIDKTLRHQRTLRPADFSNDKQVDTQPSPSSVKTTSAPPASLLSARDPPPAPEHPDPASVRAQSPTSPPGAQRISRALRREKTLKQEDFAQARKENSPPCPPPTRSTPDTMSPAGAASPPIRECPVSLPRARHEGVLPCAGC